jgi:SulP family sulfate permease
MRKVSFIDSTGIHNLELLCQQSQREGIQVVLSGVNENVHATLQKAGVIDMLGKENVCRHINIALERASKLAEV